MEIVFYCIFLHYKHENIFCVARYNALQHWFYKHMKMCIVMCNKLNNSVCEKIEMVTRLNYQY